MGTKTDKKLKRKENRWVATGGSGDNENGELTCA